LFKVQLDFEHSFTAMPTNTFYFILKWMQDFLVEPVGLVVTLYICIRELLGWNIGQETGNPDRRFVVFLCTSTQMPV
jgi:hypothetical protein